ncbi:hypothetical protein EVAR_48886_1 [Eumeta japonica]|uniref:Uncharacterized protein n=1 Tax=Eumeta variegata TaxID=151549 RepID=A0A4C1YWS2_EUMVA|nr:hypothetical protein EVAR_48886_1 [Eumeta japonica]
MDPGLQRSNQFGSVRGCGISRKSTGFELPVAQTSPIHFRASPHRVWLLPSPVCLGEQPREDQRGMENHRTKSVPLWHETIPASAASALYAIGCARRAFSTVQREKAYGTVRLWTGVVVLTWLVSPLWSLPSRPGKGFLGLNALRAISADGSISDKISETSGGRILPSVRLLSSVWYGPSVSTRSSEFARRTADSFGLRLPESLISKTSSVSPSVPDDPVDTIPYSPCPGRCKTVSSSSSGHPLPVHKPPWLSHIPRPHTGVC